MRPIKLCGMKSTNAKRPRPSCLSSAFIFSKPRVNFGSWVWDIGAGKITWSDQLHEIYGVKRGDFGGTFGEFLNYVHADDRDAVQRKITAAMNSAGQFEIQERIVRPSGELRHLRSYGEAIRDSRGEVSQMMGICQDVTEQIKIRAALENTRERLAQSQKMEALGQLPGGIAHDFNNLLMIVSGQSQRLKRKISDAALVQVVNSIAAAAERGATLTRRLLAFSRNQQLMPTIIDLSTRLESLVGLLTSSLRGDIEVMTAVPKDIWPVEVDQAEFELALVNIAVNARDAMPSGGRFILSAANTTLELNSHIDRLAGDFVAIALTDTGTGIHDETLGKIFEPFFTTKEVGKGTGLGLAQVHGFAHQSGGTVTVESRLGPDPGQGTTITLYLPRSRTAAVQAPVVPLPDALRRTECAVLLVEDDPKVGEVTQAMLEELGCSVVYVPSAAEALKALGDGAQINLLFSDIVMPEMNGLDLAEEVSLRYPGLAILLASGYSEALRSETRFTVLRKPFRLDRLEAEIGKVLKKA